jgi:hypothetical protein
MFAYGYVQRHGRQGENVSTKSMRSICAEKNYAKLSTVLKVTIFLARVRVCDCMCVCCLVIL